LDAPGTVNELHECDQDDRRVAHDHNVLGDHEPRACFEVIDPGPEVEISQPCT